MVCWRPACVCVAAPSASPSTISSSTPQSSTSTPQSSTSTPKQPAADLLPAASRPHRRTGGGGRHWRRTTMWQLAAFGCALVLFHGSEFLLAAVFMRNQLSLRSLLFSWPYTCAMAAGVAEFLLEAALLPALKQSHLVSCAGLALVFAGEALRKAAMVTAASNFTHDIQTVKRPTHTLITHGIYRHMRHPGYAGWLLWAVASQLLLVNPVCSVVFAVVAWRFFQRRIAYEDWTLRRFFGAQHAAYAAATPSGLPFIP